MIRRISILLILLFSFLAVISSQNGITVKLLSADTLVGHYTAPQFKGGEEALCKYFADKVMYPALLIKIEMEGDVHVRFVIEKDGSIGDVEILKGFDPLADDQIIEAIEKMPQWSPGTISSEGETIALPIEMEFDFKLNDDLRNRLPEIEKEEKDRKSKQNIAAISDSEESEANKEQTGNISETKSDTLRNRLPEFPGGQKALDEYLKTNMKYPKRAIQMGIEGRVVFNLSVSSEGEITKIELFKGIYSECNEEAFYLIKKMPKWIPGLKEGKPTAMQIMLPIPFVLPQ